MCRNCGNSEQDFCEVCYDYMKARATAKDGEIAFLVLDYANRRKTLGQMSDAVYDAFREFAESLE